MYDTIYSTTGSNTDDTQVIKNKCLASHGHDVTNREERLQNINITVVTTKSYAVVVTNTRRAIIM